MVGGGVDEDSTLVPGSTFHSDVLVNVAQTLQLTVADHDRCGLKREQFHTPLLVERASISKRTIQGPHLKKKFFFTFVRNAEMQLAD